MALNYLLHKCGYVPKADFDAVIVMNQELCTNVGRLDNEFQMLKSQYEKIIVEGTDQLKACTAKMDEASRYIQNLECALVFKNNYHA